MESWQERALRVERQYKRLLYELELVLQELAEQVIFLDGKAKNKKYRSLEYTVRQGIVMARKKARETE